MRIHAAQAYLPGGAAENVAVSIDGATIRAVETGAAPAPGDIRVDALIPGMSNLHSHAFQRGFAGLTEHRGESRDSFWTWREMMYRFALALSPDEMQAIVALACVEMLEAGYTRLGEFHYLHHGTDGRPYADPAEMSARIFAAAARTGIALTHLPVFYAHGGFGPAPAGEGQRRFLHSPDAFRALMERCDQMLTRPQDRLGLAAHSLRGATVGEIATLAEDFPGRPFHIHVAEQLREVEDCLAHTGARPVAWLLDNAPVGPDWCLIHATHLDAAEITGIARAGAVAGLCPVTEANLGDGIFPAGPFLDQGGCFGIGTDSNIRISLSEELRLLEYSQRLASHERNLFAGAGGSTGERLFTAALEGGARALGVGARENAAAEIAVGAPADLVGLRDSLSPGAAPARLLDRWIFGPDLRVSDVWAWGVRQVEGGRHIARDAIRAEAAAALRTILHRA
ncbi:formimidoylglutamate deiminase [Pseudogemmobacter bohemicus]|uniref:formimidoylglutamate deiminase n=1 Tax=Pseudogemmobacter bohemicus TaxID=2250708 RepID=UPI000DD2C5CD|nr:formimidoylglutamate deiminase [Pseudogemmobacter bohemicus]